MNNNAKRSRNRNTVQSLPDDVYGTMRNTTNYDSVTNNQYQSTEDLFLGRQSRTSAGTTPPENSSGQSYMDADPRQASTRALKNGTKNSR
jgi:hypothetical protein